MINKISPPSKLDLINLLKTSTLTNRISSFPNQANASIFSSSFVCGCVEVAEDLRCPRHNIFPQILVTHCHGTEMVGPSPERERRLVRSQPRGRLAKGQVLGPCAPSDLPTDSGNLHTRILIPNHELVREGKLVRETESLTACPLRLNQIPHRGRTPSILLRHTHLCDPNSSRRDGGEQSSTAARTLSIWMKATVR